MILLVSGSTKSVREQAPSSNGRLGHLLTPLNGNKVETILETGLPWAIDNGAFKKFEPNKFMTLLDESVGKPRCLFVAAPDVVANANRTIFSFYHWWPVLKKTGQPIAFVLQDGQENMPLPPDRFYDALFIGGSTKFKLSREAAALGQEGKRRGKWLHMGRVNTPGRIRHAADIGCDSIDGTSTSMFGDTYISPHLRSIANNLVRKSEQPLIAFEDHP